MNGVSVRSRLTNLDYLVGALQAAQCLDWSGFFSFCGLSDLLFSPSCNHFIVTR